MVLLVLFVQPPVPCALPLLPYGASGYALEGPVTVHQLAPSYNQSQGVITFNELVIVVYPLIDDQLPVRAGANFNVFGDAVVEISNAVGFEYVTKCAILQFDKCG